MYAMKSRGALTGIMLLCCFSLFASLSYAQNIPTNVQGIVIRLSNENPTPGQTITITAESFIADLNSSNITWTVNGIQHQKGTGLTSIQVDAPELGKQKLVRVSAVTPDGKSFSENVTLGSGILDLILETDSYAPPFFRGKIPLTYESSYRVIALPHLADATGKIYDPQTLVYTWEKDSKVVQDQSGYGKQVFSWKDESVPRQRSITVKTSTRDGRAQAEKTILVEATSPWITFYNDDPLYGPLFNSAVGTQVGLGRSGELSIIAVPFGFSKPNKGTGNLSFGWTVNGALVSDLTRSQSITVRAPGDAAGSSEIGLEIRNMRDILQGARRGFTTTFTKRETSTAPRSDFNINSNGI